MEKSANSKKRPVEDLEILDDVHDDEVDEGDIRNRRSTVWNEMKRIESDDKSETKAKCNHCKQVFTAKSRNGTSHFKRHVEKCVAKNHRSLKNFVIGTETTSQGQSMSLKNPKIDHEELRKTICMYVVAGAHSFSTVEELGFKNMLAVACPSYKVLSRHTIRRDALKHYDEERKIVELDMQNASGRICFISDN
ncbi:zinc finger BED domain-containing protein RICESLEEPER 3-like [Amaranthus tricolor]|uniref:zinc finger BED domain-containing protein RICESLEEPER 3-like n=1 Tax=Amaranthus tricolor TaxID=29722 RepID=UPI00258B84ED|nr:zinc finger BED domain-containing protein RICESLEEPER 3-like [Amaranthus tricolor]